MEIRCISQSNRVDSLLIDLPPSQIFAVLYFGKKSTIAETAHNIRHFRIVRDNFGVTRVGVYRLESGTCGKKRPVWRDAMHLSVSQSNRSHPVGLLVSICLIPGTVFHFPLSQIQTFSFNYTQRDLSSVRQSRSCFWQLSHFS